MSSLNFYLDPYKKKYFRKIDLIDIPFSLLSTLSSLLDPKFNIVKKDIHPLSNSNFSSFRLYPGPVRTFLLFNMMSMPDLYPLRIFVVYHK